MSDAPTTCERHGRTWNLRPDGTLDIEPMDDGDSKRAWDVFAYVSELCRARGEPVPADPLIACVRLAYTAMHADFAVRAAEMDEEMGDVPWH